VCVCVCVFPTLFHTRQRAQRVRTAVDSAAINQSFLIANDRLSVDLYVKATAFHLLMSRTAITQPPPQVASIGVRLNWSADLHI